MREVTLFRIPGHPSRITCPPRVPLSPLTSNPFIWFNSEGYSLCFNPPLRAGGKFCISASTQHDRPACGNKSSLDCLISLHINGQEQNLVNRKFTIVLRSEPVGGIKVHAARPTCRCPVVLCVWTDDGNVKRFHFRKGK